MKTKLSLTDDTKLCELLDKQIPHSLLLGMVVLRRLNETGLSSELDTFPSLGYLRYVHRCHTFKLTSVYIPLSTVYMHL